MLFIGCELSGYNISISSSLNSEFEGFNYHVEIYEIK